MPVYQAECTVTFAESFWLSSAHTHAYVGPHIHLCLTLATLLS